MAEQGSAAETGKHELVLTREFAAPRELVFKVWTTAEHLKRWFGPKGFTVPMCEMDFRPGGAFRFVFRGPDGKDYPSEGEYVAIEPPSRLAWKGVIHEGLAVWTEVRFTEREGKTMVRVHQRFAFESPATRGAPIGWSQTLDSLGNYLATL